MEKMESIEQFQDISASNTLFVLLKHSLTCPISAAAFEEFKAFAEKNEGIDSYYLTVQDARPLSNHIAETYEVKHESPQALLFMNNKVVWDASHRKITEAFLSAAVNENK